MKIFKRVTAVLFGVLALFMLLVSSAFAAGKIDQEVSLSISYQNGAAPLTGAKFDIYLVAEADEAGKLTRTQAFSQYPVEIPAKDSEGWRKLASTLEGYVSRDKLSPADSGRTDSRGMLRFPTGEQKLTSGLYLVLGHRLTRGGYYYDASPFLILLPGLDQKMDSWVYAVTAKAKYTSKSVPDEPGGSDGSDGSTVSRKALKVWKDEGHEQERPKEITVQLLRDGNIYDTVTLNAENNWSCTWSRLNDRYAWTLSEKEVPGYTAEVYLEGISFVVKNTYRESSSGDNPPGGSAPEGSSPGEPGSPSADHGSPDGTVSGNEDLPLWSGNSVLPQTGQLWWPVPVLLAAGLLFVVIGLIRRRGTGYEE